MIYFVNGVITNSKKIKNYYSKCPCCGYHAFNGVECFDCGYHI